MPQPKCEGCVARLWLGHGKFCQLHLAYPILHFATVIFFQIFSGAQCCPQMPLTLHRDVNHSSLKSFSSALHLSGKPTFLSGRVVSQIRPSFSQFIPSLLYCFQRSRTTCVISIPALFHITQDTQACNQGWWRKSPSPSPRDPLVLCLWWIWARFLLL